MAKDLSSRPTPLIKLLQQRGESVGNEQNVLILLVLQRERESVGNEQNVLILLVLQRERKSDVGMQTSWLLLHKKRCSHMQAI